MKRIVLMILTVIACSAAFSAAQQPAVRSISNLSFSSSYTEDGSSRTITLTWKKSTNDDARYVYIFRSTKQIFSNSIASLVPAAKLNAETVSWSDTPPKDSIWYYAVLSAAQDGTLLDIVIPTVNATISGFSSAVQNKTPTPAAVSKRPPVSERSERSLIPLPFLNMEKDTVKAASISKEAAAAAAQHSGRPRSADILPLFIFPEEKTGGGTGEQYLLSEIISTYFVQNDWEKSESELKKFLLINRSTDITRRAKFYLGQVYYYQGYYRDSLNALIEAEDIFPSKTKQWITAVLQKMPL